MCLLTFFTSSLEKYLFQFFSIGLFGSFGIELRDFFIFFDIDPLSEIYGLQIAVLVIQSKAHQCASVSTGWSWPLQGCALS